MVLIEKKELTGHPLLESLNVDGQYFPRTYFAAPDGTVYQEVKKDTPKHKFFMFPKEVGDMGRGNSSWVGDSTWGKAPFGDNTLGANTRRNEMW